MSESLDVRDPVVSFLDKEIQELEESLALVDTNLASLAAAHQVHLEVVRRLRRKYLTERGCNERTPAKTEHDQKAHDVALGCTSTGSVF